MIPDVDEALAKKSLPPTVKSLVEDPEVKVVRPVCDTERSAVPVDDETTNGLTPAFPSTARVAVGVEVPTPRRVLVLSKKKLALFCDTSPPAVMNGTEPVVSPER